MDREEIEDYLKRLERTDGHLVDTEDTDLDKLARAKVSGPLAELEVHEPNIQLLQETYKEYRTETFNRKFHALCDIIGLKTDTQLYQFIHHLLIWQIQGRSIDGDTLDELYQLMKEEYIQGEKDVNTT